MDFSKEQLASLIDISAVKAESNLSEVKDIIDLAKAHRFFAVFTLPSMTPYAKELLSSERGILLGGTVGFPSGASTTSAKSFEADELVQLGCDELDMVINIGKLKSAIYEDVALDIKRIVNLVSPIPVKVILEVSLLLEDEIVEGAKIVRDSGARFIKTGTGWSGATTVEHIQLIKKTVGESIQLKVAGGVRALDVLLQMQKMGVTRFGLGHRSAKSIIEEYLHRQEGSL